jgi:hypothetical protein
MQKMPHFDSAFLHPFAAYPILVFPIGLADHGPAKKIRGDLMIAPGMGN